MKVGFSQVCITPPIGVHLEGYSARILPSVGVHDDLYATTLALEIGGEQFLIVSCDLIGITNKLVKIVKDRIKAHLGIPAGNILLAATHTHSGPVMLGLQRSDKLCEKWKEYLPDYIVGGVQAAVRSLQEGVLAYGSSPVTYVAKNRRIPNGPIDPQLFVLHFKGADGKELGGVINYTCHGTVLDHSNLLISSDYIGFLRKHIHLIQQTTAPFLFLNGAEGDINIGYSADLSALGKNVGRARTFMVAEKIGKVLAFESARVIEEMEDYHSPRFIKALTRKVTIKVRKPRDKYVLEKLIRDTSDPLENFYLREEYEFMGVCHSDKVDIDLQIIKLDDLYIFAIPGEPFVEIGLTLKKYATGTSESIVVGLANGWFGYIPTEKAFKSVGYETRLGKWSYLDKSTESIILETFLDMMREMDK